MFCVPIPQHILRLIMFGQIHKILDLDIDEVYNIGIVTKKPTIPETPASMIPIETWFDCNTDFNINNCRMMMGPPIPAPLSNDLNINQDININNNVLPIHFQESDNINDFGGNGGVRNFSKKNGNRIINGYNHMNYGYNNNQNKEHQPIAQQHNGRI